MTNGEDLLWDAADKGTAFVPRLRRTAVTAACAGLFVLVLWTSAGATWAAWATAAYVLMEIAYRLWDRRRLVEIHVVVTETDGLTRLRLRQAGGRTTEHDPHHVARVLIIRDNVVDTAKLRLRLNGKVVLFGRAGRPPGVTAWRKACPRAHIQDRNAWWGMPGVPD
ncbi:hypothetical protein [Streptomyces sp. NPDC057540]|uniref:hypothetical protein n=1 Tax=Streptomyces sp. NPDC057540 TaxID=3346160 RepID=UPI0036B72E28